MHEYTTASKRIFSGRVLALDCLDIRREDGVPGVREIVRHRGAVGVLARETGGDFLLVRQFRVAFEAEVIEICAGLKEDGETPEQSARREFREETGREALRLVPLGSIWASPGYTTEAVDLFYAECPPAGGATAFDADEHVEIVRFSPAAMEQALRENRIRDSKTIAAWGLYRLLVSGAGAA
jgi:ADP-ribose pyrophosphatase